MSLQGPDPRERPGGERPKAAAGALRRWGPPALALVVAAGFGAGVWSAYGRPDPLDPGFEPPLVKADPHPAKTRPADPGGWRAPHEDKLVFETLIPGPPAPGAERLLPGPEQPLPKPEPPPETAAAEPAEPSPGTPIEVGETVAVPLPGQGGAAVPPPPAPGPRLLAAPATPPAEAGPVEAADAPPTPAEPPARIEEAKVAAAPASGFRLQLASFRDRASADAAWRRLRRAHPAVLGALEPQIVEADLGARGAWYRLQASGLQSEAAARAACHLLKSQKQDCLVVKPG